MLGPISAVAYAFQLERGAASQAAHSAHVYTNATNCNSYVTEETPTQVWPRPSRMQSWRYRQAPINAAIILALLLRGCTRVGVTAPGGLLGALVYSESAPCVRKYTVS